MGGQVGGCAGGWMGGRADGWVGVITEGAGWGYTIGSLGSAVSAVMVVQGVRAHLEFTKLVEFLCRPGLPADCRRGP